MLSLIKPFSKKIIKNNQMSAASGDSRKTGDIAWAFSVFVLVFGTLFTIFVLIFQHTYYSKPVKADLSQVQIADEEAYRFNIDSITDSRTLGNYVFIKGWALHKGQDLNHFNTELVLYKDSLENCLVFKLAMQTRTDVTEYFDDGYDYDLSGFSANVKSSYIGGNEYKIALLYNDTETDDGAAIILTGETFISEEED
ncbi:MAG: hypothetical protein LUC92_03200 [Clostridiales bacterium]|nr:hypothetical protein [Clostridiales bacterium]